MYSKNDYRYYLEHQLMMSDDYLAHYGVKGMKWHKHKAAKAIVDILNGTRKSIAGEYWSTRFGGANAVRSAADQARRNVLAAKSSVKPDRKRNKSKTEVISFKDQKTGKEYKNPPAPKKKRKPKNQKVTVITSPDYKRSKKESDWNKEMQSYGKEILAEQNKKKKRR